MAARYRRAQEKLQALAIDVVEDGVGDSLGRIYSGTAPKNTDCRLDWPFFRIDRNPYRFIDRNGFDWRTLCYFSDIASIYTAGAAEGPIIALLTAANLSRIQALFVIEIPFFGTRIALSRYIICLFMPPLIGIVGSALFRLF